MPEMDYDYPAVPLKAIFEGAKDFGLNDDEVWSTVNQALYWADDEMTMSEYLEQLTAALARCIISKERRIRSPDVRSPDAF
jgi:hypothetical protein